ncbi:MAG TPA: SprB repeat-containing protein [Cyclobacteriaceae bacterium]|jgi:hypothetical protein
MKRLACIICFVYAVVGCSDNDIPEAFDCTTSTLALGVETVQPASACDASDGSITVLASGGAEPYKYSVGGSGQDEPVLDGLSPGIYTVSVTDANGCTAQVPNVTVPSPGLAVTTDLSPDTSCLEGTGAVTVEVSEGTPPYEYRLADGPYGAINIFEGLKRGPHVISVRDGSGCEMQLNVTIPRGNTGVSWKDDILPIVKASCALSGCHDGLVRPDLSHYDKAKFYAQKMKEYTQDKSMPFEGSIPQEQIDLIACWVDDGAPNN